MRMPALRGLSTQILASQLAILTGTVAIGFGLFVHQERRQLDRQYEMRAASIAQTTAGVPAVVACMSEPSRCTQPLQEVASRIVRETGASYVVIIDRDRVRHSHPLAALVGQRVDEPLVALDGHTHVGIDEGSTGRSANGRAPVLAPDGSVVGEVSAGLRESTVSAALRQELPQFAEWWALSLLAGAAAAVVLARRLKRRTFGLELDEIARLLQEREATLHGIREGVVAFDPQGRVSMVNDEARRLLGLWTAPVGGRLDDLVPPGRLRGVLSGSVQGQDEVVLTDDFALTVNWMPVVLGGQALGAVVTLRDRTEMSGLLRELDSVRSLSESLRAQQHEFANRLHTLVGLLELGQADEALGYLTDLRATSAALGEELSSRIASPLLVGLLLGKSSEAAERGVRFVVTEDSWLGDVPDRVQALTTILGNLVDNALEAVAAVPDPVVQVALLQDDDRIIIAVSDNGPGVPSEAREDVFLDGWSTKPPRGDLRRGLGLALVHRLVQRLGGTVHLDGGPGARFMVALPVAQLVDDLQSVP